MSFYDLPLVFYPVANFYTSLKENPTLIYKLYKTFSRFVIEESVAPNPHDISNGLYPKAKLAITTTEDSVLANASFVEEIIEPDENPEPDDDAIAYPHVRKKTASKFEYPTTLLLTASLPDEYQTNIPGLKESIFQVVQVDSATQFEAVTTPNGLLNYVLRTLNPILPAAEPESESEWVLHFAFIPTGEPLLAVAKEPQTNEALTESNYTGVYYYPDESALLFTDNEVFVEGIDLTVDSHLRLADFTQPWLKAPRFPDHRFDVLAEIPIDGEASLEVLDQNHLTIYCWWYFDLLALLSERFADIASLINDGTEGVEIEYNALFITKDDAIAFASFLPSPVVVNLINFFTKQIFVVSSVCSFP